MRALARIASGVVLLTAHAALAAALPACAPTRPGTGAARPAPAASPGEPDLSEAHGTTGSGPVIFSHEPLGGPDNAAAAPSDNVPRAIPFHKAPPPRQVPE